MANEIGLNLPQSSDQKEVPVRVGRDAGRLWYAMKERHALPDRRLPIPTRDPAELRADLDSHGYCFVADALSRDEAKRINDRIVNQIAAEQRMGLIEPSEFGYASCSNLLNKGEIFQQLFFDELVDELLEHLLGREFLLSTLGATRTLPGSRGQGLHIDQHLAGFAAPIPLVANACWMLEDFTEENGATRVIPGSHLWSPEMVKRHYQGINNSLPGQNPPNTVAAVGEAGTAMIFEGRILHGTGANVTKDQTRTGLFQYCCRGWIRAAVNPFLSMSDDILSSMPERILQRLGFYPNGYAGGYQRPGNPVPKGVIRPTDQIRELN